jgi:hypothetical protein
MRGGEAQSRRTEEPKVKPDDEVMKAAANR